VIKLLPVPEPIKLKPAAPKQPKPRVVRILGRLDNPPPIQWRIIVQREGSTNWSWDLQRSEDGGESWTTGVNADGYMSRQRAEESVAELKRAFATAPVEVILPRKAGKLWQRP
jgi:hypothetical protein